MSSLSETTAAKSVDGTRARLINCAEKLFGQHGIGAVSLRAIGAAAGQRNEKAVQYHFKTKDGLIVAIFEARVPWLELRRREMLEVALKQYGKRCAVRPLLEILTKPLAELVDENGCIAYAQFLLQLSVFKSERRIIEIPVELKNSGSTLLREVFRLLNRLLPKIPLPILAARIEVVIFSFLSVIVERQNALDAGQTVWPLELATTHVLDMAEAAIMAPVSPHLTQAVATLPRHAYPWYDGLLGEAAERIKI